MVADDHVPGTVHLVDIAGQLTEGAHAGQNGDIVLVPQPSNDPQDPLNWTRKRKFWSLAMVFVYILGVGIPGTLHYSVIANITADTGISTADLVQGNGVMFLFLGWGCLFWQPIAIAYGRRGVYLASVLLTVPLMVWTAYSNSAGVWYAHRIIIGILDAPIEALPEISIPDLFFAHERGTWMSTYVLLLFGSNFIAPLIAGWFADAYGWRWTMHFGAMIAAVAFVILFFGMEETMYFRNTVEGVEPITASAALASTSTVHGKDEKSGMTTPDTPDTSSPDSVSLLAGKSRSRTERLKPFVLLDGRPTPKQVMTMMYRPLLIIVQFPCIAWAGFIYGINLSWYNVLNGTASPILSAPPYNWSSALVGCIYVGPIIGAILGCLWAGKIADKLAIYLARKNNGVREPEQRLWPLTIAAVFSAAGLITWVSQVLLIPSTSLMQHFREWVQLTACTGWAWRSVSA